MEARRCIIQKESQTLCTRLFHDLLGPIGSLGMGLELLESAPSSEVWALIHSNIQTLKAKVIFFRTALGKEDSSISSEKIQGLLESYGQATKIKIQFPSVQEERDPQFHRLLLYFFLNIPDFLPRGGSIIISPVKKGRTQLTLQGPLCLTPPPFQKILDKINLDTTSPKEIFYVFLLESLILNQTEIDYLLKEPNSHQLILQTF